MSIDAIRNLQLAPLDLPDIDCGQTMSVDGGPAAMINAGSIVAFEAGITAAEQEDVLYSTQLAQRAASAVADRFTDPKAWYREYVRVLGETGWAFRNFNFHEQQVDQSDIEVAKSALKILAAAITGPQTAVLLAAITALEGMAKDDGFITLFEHFGSNGAVGNVQVSEARRSAPGELSIALGAFQIKMTERQEKFLFITLHKKGISVWGDVTEAAFNRSLYAEVREIVREKLGANARKVIAQVPLAAI